MRKRRGSFAATVWGFFVGRRSLGLNRPTKDTGSPVPLHSRCWTASAAEVRFPDLQGKVISLAFEFVFENNQVTNNQVTDRMYRP
jgi:hypothetical protein